MSDVARAKSQILAFTYHTRMHARTRMHSICTLSHSICTRMHSIRVHINAYSSNSILTNALICTLYALIYMHSIRVHINAYSSNSILTNALICTLYVRTLYALYYALICPLLHSICTLLHPICKLLHSIYTLCVHSYALYMHSTALYMHSILTNPIMLNITYSSISRSRTLSSTYHALTHARTHRNSIPTNSVMLDHSNTQSPISHPPKNGLIALQTPRTCRLSTFYYCQVVNRAFLRLLSTYI